MQRKQWAILGVLLAVPLALFLMAAKAASWRPQTLAVFAGPVRQVKFSPDGKTLAVVSDESPAAYEGAQEITFWDTQRRTLAHRIAPCMPWLAGLVFSPNSRIVMVGREQPFPDPYVPGGNALRAQMRLVDTQTMQVLGLLSEGSQDFMTFWHSNAVLMAVGEPTQDTGLIKDPGTIMDAGAIKNEHVGPFMRRKRVTEFDTSQLEFSSDGDTIASLLQPPGCNNCYEPGAYDGMQIWSFKTGEKKFVLDNTDSNSPIKFSPDGKMIADDHVEALNVPNTVRLWDVQTGKLQRTFTLPPSGGASSLAFSPEGKMLAAASQYPNSPVVLWDAQTGKLARTLVAPNGGINDIDFSPDGCWLASANADRKVVLWRIK